MGTTQDFLKKHPTISLLVFLGVLLVLTIISFGFFLTQYGTSEERALDKLNGSNVLNLEAEAVEIWSGGNEYRIVEKNSWPIEANNLNPRSISVREQRGVYFQTGGWFVEQDGLFYLPQDSPFEPPARGDPSFKHLRGRWYYFLFVG